MADHPKRFRLRTVGGLLTELGRIYKLGHNGKMAWQDVAAASRVLREMRTMIEGDQVERRLSAIEARLDANR